MNTIDKIREIKQTLDMDLFRFSFRLGKTDYEHTREVEELIYGNPDISETEAVELLNNLQQSIQKDKQELSAQINSKQKELDRLKDVYDKLNYVK
ncbi:hypothetical protein [Staphylococcus saprophyticus]|uniref:hypothetical protein n=1 Tax=Staphylococcus saprophyticus TaxID=29385 RepID=UPI002DBFECC3|nr:hypothetical protein [Staphylococcus saprophyticus]MEB8335788.1 hypothetical protein [Staphylococcus saprophyticus]